MKSVFSSINHIPTIRELPNYSFQLNGGRFKPEDYYSIPRILDEDRFLPKLIEKVNEVLSTNFDLNEKILLFKEELSGALQVKNTISGTTINLLNSSSGLQQILPIITLLINNQISHTVFLCEQPELHLHPSLQTKLAIFLTTSYTNIDRESSSGWSFEPGIKIIETHSEHIIRKVQVLIAKNEVDKNNVAVYYFDNKSGETKVTEMKFLENGFFKEPWPDGFFDEASDLVWELMKVQAERNN